MSTKKSDVVYTAEERRQTLKEVLTDHGFGSSMGKTIDPSFHARKVAGNYSMRVWGDWFNMGAHVTLYDMQAGTYVKTMDWEIVDPELDGDEYHKAATFKMFSIIKYIQKNCPW